MDYELQKTIQRILNKLLDPSISESVSQKHLSCLLQHLSVEEDDLGTTGTPKLEETFFLSWIKQAVDKWKLIASGHIPKNMVLFAADLTVAMCTVETTFVKLTFTKILDDFIEILRMVPEPPNEAPIKLSYIHLIASFLSHKSGIQWIMSTNYWFDIYTMISQSLVKEIMEESCQFVIQLLEKSQNNNEIFCYNIIDVVIAPLKDLTEIYTANSEAENMALTLSLKILNKMLQGLLVNCCNINDFRIIHLFNDKFNLDGNLTDLIVTVTNPRINYELNKISLIILTFSAIESLLKGCNPFDMKPVHRRNRIANIIINAARYHGANEILELVYLLHVLMSHIPSILNNNHVFKPIENSHRQLIVFLAQPVHSFSMEVLGIKVGDQTDELRKQHTSKIWAGLVTSFSDAYKEFRRFPIKFSVEDATLALRYFVSCSKFYNTGTANIATRIIIYVLVDILNGLKTKPDLISKLSEDFVVSLLDTITTLLKNFDLSWKDSIETTYLTEITSHFLNLYAWPLQVVVKALQLLDIGISKSLSPSMALLIDKPDKDVDFGKIVYNKIMDQHWQVRNAAVQVTATIAKTVKQSKFETHRTLILEVDFPALILNVAIADPELAVKISAVRCLQEIVKIREFWDSLLKNQNLYDQILQLYYLQADGVARSEAIALFTEIYRNQLFPDTVLEKVYDSLKYAVLEDQNNLVKLRGLEFWEQVIEQYLKDQGMIDGEFPDMTFSTSSKKIIRLDQNQIKKCLHNVLDQLSEMGCLTIFMFALHHSNQELRRHATHLIKKFVDVLNLYLFSSTNNMRQNNHTEEASTFSEHEDISEPFLSSDFPIIDLSPSLYDFDENFFDIDNFARQSASPCSDSSSSGISSDNSNFENDKDTDKTLFLKFAVCFNIYQKEEIHRQHKLKDDKDDIDSVIKQLLDL